MTHEQLAAETLYHASLSPFKKLATDRVISEEDYSTIDTILRAKYSPIFVEEIINLALDIKEHQR